MKIYKSKKDTWLMLITYLSSLVCLFASAFVFSDEISIQNIIIATLIFFVGCLFPLWLVTSLVYKINETMLIIICGPFRWRIEISSIKSITPSTDFLSSPALSLDRLLIVYDDGKSVLVSPQNKEGFIADLGAS
jgi:Na+/proline symporter